METVQSFGLTSFLQRIFALAQTAVTASEFGETTESRRRIESVTFRLMAVGLPNLSGTDPFDGAHWRHTSELQESSCARTSRACPTHYGNDRSVVV